MRNLLDVIKKSPHRTRLEKLIRATFPLLDGPILDIGSKNRRYDHLLKNTPTAIDIVENKEYNVIKGDILSLPFPENSFQSVLCIEVLEYIDQPARAVSEMVRVLQPGGTVVLSVPFLFKVHKDRLRYTAPYLQELFEQSCDIKLFSAVGGWYTVLLTILWGKVKNISLLPIRYVCTIFLLPLFLFRIPVTKKSKEYASGYFIVAKKR